MLFGFKSVAALSVLSAVLLLPSARADVFTFTVSNQNQGVSISDNYTFSIDTVNTPYSTDAKNPDQRFYLVSPDVTDNASNGSSYDLGPFAVINTGTGAQGIGFSELYFSTPDIFGNGTFVPTTPGSPLTVLRFSDPTDPYTLTITTNSPSTTPEPSSLLLLGSGVLGVFGMARRKLFAA